MALEEIKAAVLAGKTVHWMNTGYVVVHDSKDQWLIKFLPNDHCIGLTWADGVTLNGQPQDFFTDDKPVEFHVGETSALRSTEPHADAPPHSLRTILSKREASVFVNGMCIDSAGPAGDIDGVWRLTSAEQEFLVDPDQHCDLRGAVLLRVGFDGQSITGPHDLPELATLHVEIARPATNEDFV